MSIFTSKRPEDFDPKPYVGVSIGRVTRYAHNDDNDPGITFDPRPHFQPTRDKAPWVHDESGGIRAATWNIGFRWAPRPDFTTPSNPILVEFRDFKDEFWGPIPTRDSAQDWLDLIADDPTMDDPSNWGNLAGKVTPEQIEHARKVLSRLAAL